MWATKSSGGKVPWKIEALIWEFGGKMRREKHIAGHGVIGTSRCKESKLSLADTASMLFVFGMVLDRHCHYYLRVGLRGLTQVSPHSAVSVCLD